MIFCVLAIVILTLLSKNYHTNKVIEKEFQKVQQHVHKMIKMSGLNTQFELISAEYSNSQKTACKQNGMVVYSMDLKTWKRDKEMCNSCHKYLSTSLRTPYGPTPIMVYPSSLDPWVSGILLSTGRFQEEKSAVLFNLLQSSPNINLIDIGANIGVYTLYAAKMGRKVVAIEALDENLKHLCASIVAGGFQEKVHLVHNAISNKNAELKLGIDRNNMGGTFIDEDASHIKKLKAGRTVGTYGSIYSIQIDDLLKIPVIEDFEHVVVKMAIEGYESKALERSAAFFYKIHVAGVMMEWEFHRGQESAKSVIKIMQKLNFVPHKMNVLKQRLSWETPDSWSRDVLWLPSPEE